jgi:hypothetical protein
MKSLLFSLMGLLLAAGTATAQDVRYNFDRETDFSKFKTYKWVALKDAVNAGDLLDKQIKATVDTQLATKGLTKVEADPADLYVGYQAAVSQEKEFTSYSTGMGPAWGYGPGWYGGGWYGGGMSSTTTGQTSTIYVGQLVVDMYDSTNKDLVWRGVASKSLDPEAKPEKQQNNLTKTVKKMLNNYPPKKK